jgi:hypothetical protein
VSDKRFHAKKRGEMCRVCGKTGVGVVLWNNHEPLPFRLPDGWFVVRFGDNSHLEAVCSEACAEKLPSLRGMSQ